jgi:hypothetical protein
MTKQLQATLAAIMVISAMSVPAQTTSAAPAHTTAKTKKKAPRETATERQIRELREQMQNQQAEIDSLKAQSAAKDAALAAAQQASVNAQNVAAAASSQAQTVNATVQANADAVASLQGTVTDLKNSNTGLALTISDTKKDLTEKIESPTALHYKGVLLQPTAIFMAETVDRTRAMNSDISTAFNSTPYMNTPQAYTSEFNATARQSRIALNIVAPTEWGKMGGYFETDFLSAGTTSNDNQTNSYTLRIREAFAQASTKHFTISAGQMFTLATEVKKGINPGPGAENLPQTIDPQYHVGFTFLRQYGARFAYSTPKYAVAFALEQPQTILAGTTNAPATFFFGNAGLSGGLYNSTGSSSSSAGVSTPGVQNYSNNVAPDIIVKATADPGIGHYEIGGIARFFRDRLYPELGFTTTVVTVPVGPGLNNTTLGGGFFASAKVPVKKYADVALKITQGDGTARYTSSNLGDVTVKPDGSLEPLRSSTLLFEPDIHIGKKLDLIGIAGGEYLQRTSYQTTLTSSTGVATTYFTGYAPLLSKSVYTPSTGATVLTAGESDGACNTELPPGATSGYAPVTDTPCSGHTRAVFEGTAGFVYRFYNSPSKGRLQFSMLYSYLTKEAWTGLSSATVGASTTVVNPKATNNMVFTSFRYYLP